MTARLKLSGATDRQLGLRKNPARFTPIVEANSSSVCDINIDVTPLVSPRR
jgi:hypothetical protein